MLRQDISNVIVCLCSYANIFRGWYSTCLWLLFCGLIYHGEIQAIYHVERRNDVFCGFTDVYGRLSAIQCNLHWALLHLCKCVGSQNLHHLQHFVHCLHHPHHCDCIYHSCTHLLPASYRGSWLVVEVTLFDYNLMWSFRLGVTLSCSHVQLQQIISL